MFVNQCKDRSKARKISLITQNIIPTPAMCKRKLGHIWSAWSDSIGQWTIVTLNQYDNICSNLQAGVVLIHAVGIVQDADATHTELQIMFCKVNNLNNISINLSQIKCCKHYLNQFHLGEIIPTNGHNTWILEIR